VRSLAIVRRRKRYRGTAQVKRKAREARTKILFIGENADIALLTALKREGYETAACESPQEAWASIYGFRPHLIMVHLSHSGRTDIAVLQECRLMAEGIPIVVTTSIPGHETAMKALEEGATSFLFLPLERAKIKKVVDDLLAEHEN
jgi:DNA-binding NtrC family response regulator